MATYRIALIKQYWPDCIFTNVSLCTNIPDVQECTQRNQYIIDLISEKKKSFSLEFLPAENVSLMMQMVSSGQADFSDYPVRLPPELLSWKGLEHAGSLFPARNVFLFKSGKNQNASLNLLSIFPWKVYIFLILLLAALFGMRKSKNLFVTKIRFRVFPVIGIFASIFYAYLSSQVVLLFNTKVPTSEPIDSFDTLVEALASQKYRLMIDLNGADQGITAWAGQQSQGLFKRVTEAFWKNPPQKTFDDSFDDITQEILVGTEPFPVLITSSSYLPFYTQKYCGLAVVYDDIKVTEFDTFFMQRDLPGMKRITSEHRALVRAEFEHLIGMRYPMKSCYRQGLQSAHSYEPLELPQLQYVFGLVSAISGAGGMALVAI